ncbi:MAG: hypothetical protein EXQ70_10915 [Solirubrobacterales bacterium]|nr:hypothetical protein [Solirubrobacterales bacterium]
MSNGAPSATPVCTCGAVDRFHEPDCPLYDAEASGGPLLLEGILGAKKVLIFVAVLTVLALAGFVILDPLDFFG